MRVWKLDDNWSPLPVDKFQSKSEDLIAIASSSNNIAQLKKGKNYSYPRKEMEKDHGFVSVLPYGPKTIQIQFSGVPDHKYALQIWDADKKNMVKSWTLIQEKEASFYQDFLVLQDVKSGKYLLIFQSVSAKGKVNNSKAIPFTLP
jgi:methionine-rich copper-binding protein CopC